MWMTLGKSYFAILEQMKRNLASGIRIYDPWVTDNIVPNQYYDLDKFLDDVAIVVIMVGHKEIRDNLSKLKNKIVLDTKNLGIIEKTHAQRVYML